MAAPDYSVLDLFDRETLEAKKAKCADELFTLVDQGATADATGQKKQMLAEINKRLERLPAKVEPKVETQLLPYNNYSQFSIECASIRSQIDKVAKFEPGREIAEFLSDLDNIFARVSTDARLDNKVQHCFVSSVMAQMATNYQQDIRVYENGQTVKTEWTWTTFRAYLEKTYETNKSQFQVLQALEKLEKLPTESQVDFAGKIQLRLGRIETLLRANVVKKYGENTELTVKHVLSMVGGMVILKKMETDTDLMNYLTRDLDDCFSAHDIAKLADKYIERRKVTSSDQVLSNPTANFARDLSKLPCHSE